MTTLALLAALALTGAEGPDQPPATPPADNAVSGVTVSGARKEVETAIDRRSYSVANDLQGQTGSIGDVLRNIPSVQVDVQGNLSLRGDGNVTVLIDGQRSSQFRGESLAQALQSMPANRIDRIEVITNPSAEFRADGTGGVINLVTRKAKGAGPTGSIQAMARDDGGHTLSGVGGYNSNRLSLTGDAAYRHLYQNQYLNADGAALLGGTPLAFTETSPQLGVFDFGGLHGGADYEIDKRTRLTVDLRGSHFERVITAPDLLEFRDGSGTVTSALARTSLVDFTGSNGTAFTTWRRRYGEGHDLALNASYDGQEISQDRTDKTVTIAPAGVTDQNRRVIHTTYIRNPGFKADYNKPLADKTKLKLGYEFDFFNALIVDEGGLSTGAAPVMLTSPYDNRFQLVEWKNQAYVTYERPLGKLTALGGLRVESVILDLTQQTAGIETRRTYNQAYPTLHLGYDLGEGRRWTTSYSRRVNRPGIADLNPYAFSGSPQQITQGNVNLAPEYVDSLEAGYESRKGQSMFLATAYYRRTTDAFTMVATDLGGVLLAQRQNLGQRQNAGVELVRNGRINAKLTYQLSGNIYWSEISSPSLGFTTSSSGTTGFGRANLNWQAGPKDFLQVNVFANGKVLYPQGYSTPSASGNLGWRHKVNDKLSWMVVAQDPFATLKNSLVLDLAAGPSRRETRSNSRQFTFTLVRTFGGKPRDANFDFAPGGYAGG